ncbi:MAG: hypothetical protein WA634_10655 [Silvibacterium sp.]
MKKLLYRTMRVVLFGLLAAALPAVAQDNQQPKERPAPNRQTAKPQHGGQKPGAKPAPGNGQARPQPSRPNPEVKPNPGNGQTRPQPSRPNPGVKPTPGRPNPGVRPTPGRPNPGRPTPGRPNPGARPPSHRPPQWGRPPARRPSYQFRPNDRAYLHRYYLSRLGRINRARRPVFVIGGYFPYADIGYISPLPPDLYGYLPPPPPGYQMGYYDGYVVVYDPVTYFIVNVIDLMQ